MACGVAVPAERCVEALDVCFKVYKDEGDVLPLILSHRFVKGTQATLGFTRFPKTAVLEIDSLNMDSTRAYLHKVWNALDAAGIPFTLHWGKFNMHLNAQQVRNRYGAAVDDWIASKKNDRQINASTRPGMTMGTTNINRRLNLGVRCQVRRPRSMESFIKASSCLLSLLSIPRACEAGPCTRGVESPDSRPPP